MKWYKNLYRRHLLDMHIEDWDERFLSEFSPDEYVENLKLAKIQCAMIYLQSHVGLCNFPTKVAEEHRAFVGNDKMQRLIKLCHENGIKVVGYYSLIHNNRAEINHPEWKMIEADGKTPREKGGRYGFVCPNNEEYRAFVVEQIKEMHENFELDGVFYDMPFWPDSCRCKSCRERWQKEVGGDMPEPDLKAPRFKEYAKKLQEWMAEFCAFVAQKTHEIMPEVSIEFNNAGIVAFDWTAGSTEKISDVADYAGGDYSVRAKASKNVETVTFRAENAFYLSAVSLSADKDCIYPVEITVKTGRKPVRVKELSCEKEISFAYENGAVTFKDEINLHASYEIKL